MSTLQKRREKIVHDHMDAENRKDSEATLATFQRPRYEVIPTGEVYSGASSVKAFLRESMTAFPNFKFKDRRLHHASGVVVVEVTFEGTHEGFWRGLPPTGRSVSYRMCNI